MADVKYQVFVSSTYKDLIEERRVIMEQILKRQHIPVGMEQFNASNTGQWETIKKRILGCDYYIVIVAETYGSVDSDGISYTEKEYRFAVENNIPLAALLLKESERGKRIGNFSEQKRKTKIDAFRKLCSEKKMVEFWTNSGDLALAATNALSELIETEARSGWVKADASAEVAYKEVTRLSAENAELRNRLGELETMPLRPSPEVDWQMSQLAKLEAETFASSDEDLSNMYDYDLLVVFVDASRVLSTIVSRYKAIDRISKCIRVKDDPNKFDNVASRILAEFAARGVVQYTAYPGKNELGFDETSYFVGLTDFGRSLLLHAERRSAESGEAPDPFGLHV